MKIFAILMALLTTLSNTPVQNVEIYAKTAVVVDVDYENNLVTVSDMMKREWAFYGTEDWFEGDIASLLMSDNGTPETCYDDIILDARYDGWIDNYEEWFYEG